MRINRVEAFSDGVFAVAITLLVLQFAVPEVQSGKLYAALVGQWPNLAAYVASFLTIGVMWVNHHTVLSHLKAVDRGILFINLVLLLFVVLVPYPTALLGHYLPSAQNGSVAAAFYAVIMTCISIGFQALVRWSVNHPKLLKPGIDSDRIRAALPRYSIGLVVYAASIGLAFVSAWLVVALYAAAAIYYSFNQLASSDRLS
jgi:uncharacterized membrane protein